MVDSAKMAIYLYPGKILADHLSIKSHLRDAPRDTHGATADYDDTALGTGTLTVHPWRAGPDCGKLLLQWGTPCIKVINIGSDIFGNPIFQKGLQN